ncbi:MAG TPA: hypothetical protein P5036_02490 [Albidovulum sp.]|uniref:hypothetical protein n=1 Tax=Albidovulum sp. TaxID=1872424 RepID=UPI002B553C3A|nr:hypothetical protein [Albidovulum sp.]
MNESGKSKLHSLLFGGETELVNVKFFPGFGKDLTVDALSGAAADALRQAIDAMNAGVPSNPPSTGMQKRPLMG